MQKAKVADGANPDGTANDSTAYIPESWNDNLFNLFNVLINNGYSLIDDNLEQLTKVFKGKYVATYTYNSLAAATQTVNDVVEGSDGLLYEAQNTGIIADNPVGSVTGDWKTYKPEYLARIEKQDTHNMGSDANYTITIDQNTYGKLIITDTSVFLSTGRDIIVSDDERYILVQNDTLQTLTVKTSGGTGIAVIAGAKVSLFCDGTNVILLTQEVGVNQTWQNLTGSRSTAVLYTNTTGRPIALSISGQNGTSDFILQVDGLTVGFFTSGSVSDDGNIFAIVPDGLTYEVTVGTIARWEELR